MVRPVADAFEFGLLLGCSRRSRGLDRDAAGVQPAPLAIDADFTFRTIIVCVWMPRRASLSLSRARARGLRSHSKPRARFRISPRHTHTHTHRYGRSHAVPTLSEGTSTFGKLLEHPSFFIDALYVHKKPSEGGSCCQDVRLSDQV